jgi:undecaprenyl-diphosphatase
VIGLGRAAAWWRFLTERLEFRALLMIVAIGATIMAFLGLSEVVDEAAPGALDRSILLWFRTPGAPSDPVGSRTVEEVMRDITALGGFTCLTLFTVIATASLLFFGKRRHATVFAATVILAELCNDGLKAVYGRPRPQLVPHEVYVYTHSFPSGHSMLSAATFLTLAAILSSLDRRRAFKGFFFFIAILIALTVGLSRLYLGVHWPTDVLAGWTLGAAWALTARLVLGIWCGEAPKPSR